MRISRTLWRYWWRERLEGPEGGKKPEGSCHRAFFGENHSNLWQCDA